ncbi:unnamed protein product [Rotaria sp. Silwood2]|nr:unnamed protein product [Rotaria sp. Silwood2]
MATADNDSASVITIDHSEIDHLRANVLKSQIATYRLLARHLPVSDSLLQSCSYKVQLATLIQNHVQQQSEIIQPTAIILESHQNDSDMPLKFSSATNMYRWLVGSTEMNTTDEDGIPTRIRQHPISLNPLYVQQEREKRVLNRISNRLQELEHMPAQMSVELRTQALIELKSLKLLQFQKQLRSEILHTMKMTARTEYEFNLFNRMDVARREYESLHGVGSGGDGANERRHWKLVTAATPITTITITDDTKFQTPRFKRKKESDNEDSIDQPAKIIANEKKITTAFIEQSDDEGTRGGEETTTTTTTTNDETTPSPLEDLEDEEDVDFSQATPSVHRKMKINRLITDDELPEWLKNDVEEVEKTLENDEDFGKGRRQRKDIDYSDNLTEREFLQALEEGNLDGAVEQKRLKKQNRKSALSSQDNDIDLDETEARSSFDNPSTPIINQQNYSSKRGSVKKRLQTVDPKIAPQCRLLLERLLAYRTDDNRQLAQPFIRLPGQKQLPIYYQTIKDPIDFQRIKRKIDTYRYSNLDEFQYDIELLVQNAQTFNCETSLIFADSILLEKIYRNLREQLDAGLIQVPTANEQPTTTTTTATTTTTTTTTATTPRTSSRRGRGTRITTPITTNGEVSRRGRKRKLTVIKDDDVSDEDQQQQQPSDDEHDDGDFE